MNFKVGDRVDYIGVYGYLIGAKNGIIVTEDKENDLHPYEVDFGEKWEPNDRKAWPIMRKEIKLVFRKNLTYKEAIAKL